MQAVILCLIKNYHPMQKMLSVVINIYKFDQEIFTIGIFWKFLSRYLNTILVKAAFLKCGKDYTQPAQIKLHLYENFLQHAKNLTPIF